MDTIDRQTAQRHIVATAIADTASSAVAFAGDGVSVVEFRPTSGRRRYDWPAFPFLVMSTGHGVVVSCHRRWMEWAEERAERLDRHQFLGAANLGAIAAHVAEAGYVFAGPHPSYGCSVDTLRLPPPPVGVTLDVLSGSAIERLRPLDAFRNAVPPELNPVRPDMLAVVARDGDAIVACAAASAENDWLWQVGVDVLTPWRGRGVGRSVVGRLTELVLAQGKVPYYAHSISNLPSAALAISLGYWPAWVQWYAREPR